MKYCNKRLKELLNEPSSFNNLIFYINKSHEKNIMLNISSLSECPNKKKTQ